MTVHDFGPAALAVLASGELGFLVWQPSFDDAADSAAWDAAVLEAAKRGLTTGLDYPVLAESGVELYMLNR